MTWQGIVVSIGGTPEPIITALRERRPAHALFVVSAASAGEVEDKILPQLAGFAPQYQIAMVSDPQVLGTCYQEIRVRIARWLDEVRLDEGRLDPAWVYVDITGGTKVMSAALALAAVEHFSDFSYIGGAVRAPVTGRVVAGAEQVIRSANPWDTYAVRDLERANGLLRDGQPDTASVVLKDAAQKSGAARQTRLTAFADLAAALGCSDRFDFVQAVANFETQRTELERALDFAAFQKLAVLYGHWLKLRNQVNRANQKNKTPGRETLLELFANAERRARQGRYDDAVGRLYRAVELRGQQLARDAFGWELGRPALDDFPQDRREQMRALLGEPNRGSGRGRRYELGLNRLYQSLEFSDDGEIRRQSASYDAIARQLRNRNDSLLAHGVRPVAPEDYAALRREALRVCAVSDPDADIPRWPELTLRMP